MSKNTITVRTAKTEATESDVRASLEEAYPDFTVANVLDLGTEWEGVLEKDFEHTAALPFEKEDSGSDDFGDGDDKPKEKKPPKEKKEKSEPSDDESGDLGDSSSEDGDGDDFSGPGGDSSGEESPLKSIEHLLKELTDKVKQLEEKAGLVDDIHQKIKPHIEEAPMPGDLGPTAPGGGNPMGGPPGAGGPPGGGLGGPPSGPGGPGGMPGGLGDGAGGPAGGPPGGPPSIPRRPQPAKGFDRRIRDPKRGLPSAFTNVNPNVKYVHVPIRANDTEYTMQEAWDAVKEDKKYSNYRIAGIQEDLRRERYTVKLVK